MKISHHRSTTLAILAAAYLLVLSLYAGASNGLEGGDPTVDLRKPDVFPNREGDQIPLIANLEYLAIGPEEFQQTMEPLIEWKTGKGVKAAYIPLDGPDGILEPANQPWGRDRQEQIRSFIKAMWENHWNLTWVVLVGDGEIIPMRSTFVNGTFDPDIDNDQNFVLTDYYYADLEGTWDDLNRNNVFGEEGEIEWNPDVYVGRFPASNVDELSIMVERQLSYETDPPVGSWSRSTLLAGSLMDRPNIRDNPDTPMVDEGYNDYKDNAFELVTRVEALLPEHVNTYILSDYPQTQYGGYSQLFDTLNRSTFEMYFEMGFSTALLACHGDSNGNCTEYKGDGGGALPYWLDEETYFDYEMAETIENGRRVPLVYISNCDSLNFSEEDDTNMERLLCNPNGGAIGLIGATTTTYRGEYIDGGSYGNWWLAQKYFELLYNVTTRPAEALYMQKAAYEKYIWDVRDYSVEEFRMHRIDNLAYNLLGDPEGPVWIDEPKTFSASLPIPYDQGNNTFTVVVRDERTGLPVQGARVTLMDPLDPEMYIRRTTDEQGMVDLILIRESLDPLSITIDHPGYIPIVKDVDMISHRNIEIVPEIVTDPAIPSEDGYLGVGIKVKNTGSVDLYNYYVTLNISHLENDGTYVRVKTNLLMSIQTIGVNDTAYLDFEFDPSYLHSGSNILMAEAVPPINEMHKLLESDTVDNFFQKKITVNAPLYFKGTIPTQPMKEDTPLSKEPGKLDLSLFLWDDDRFPDAHISAWVSGTDGGFDAYVEDMELEIIPDPDWNGNGTVEVTASDGATFDTRTIYVRVEQVNDPPEFLWCPESLTISEDHLTNFTVVLGDIDSVSLTLRSDLAEMNIKEHEEIQKAFNVSILPNDDLVGETLITFSAFDDSGLSADFIMRIEVTQTNDPPSIGEIPQVNGTQGEKVLIELNVWDVDLDVDFTVEMEWEEYNFTSNSTSFLYKVPSDAEPGLYKVNIRVTDPSGAETEGSFMLQVEAGGHNDLNPYIFTMIIVVMVLIVIYGAFIKIQEKKQKEMVEQVGTNRALEARAVSTETFDEEWGDTIVAMPVPSEIEGDMVRKIKDGGGEPEDREEDELTGAEDDLDEAPGPLSDELDELADEMFKD